MRAEIFSCFFVALLAGACTEQSQSAKAPTLLGDSVKQACIDKEPQLIAEAKALIAEDKPEEAADRLKICFSYSTLPEFRAVDDQAYAMIAKKDLDKVPRSDKAARSAALMRLSAYGKLPAPYDAEYEKLQAEEQAKQEQRDQLAAQVAKMDFWRRCAEAGAIVRTPVENRQQPRAELVLDYIAEADRYAVKHREIRLGMDECALAASLGRPSHVNRSVGSFGRHDQWVYESGRFRYVYTEDGTVTSYQQ